MLGDTTNFERLQETTRQKINLYHNEIHISAALKNEENLFTFSVILFYRFLQRAGHNKNSWSFYYL
jgi:hypothetical protein